MNSREIRRKFIEYFAAHDHREIPSASLIPENDPTVLFTTAGMHPLVPYLLGEKHPEGRRLTSCQKCVRTDDIDEVGDDTHLTFFEMLGNWSLGDYFKEDAIKLSYEFLTKELGLDQGKLAVSVFAGDSDAPSDEEAYEIWKSLGLAEARIAKLPKKDNWWGPAGLTGPCGPDTEMFYWNSDEPAPENFQETADDPRWVEVWNDVFMQYAKTSEGKYEPLTQKNVDTGLGLERMATMLQGKASVYETDLFESIITKIRELATKEIDHSIRIIADHLRAATFIIGDPRGVTPSNVDQGYVVRKLIRRAIRHGKKLEMQSGFTSRIAEVIISEYKDVYPELAENENKILEALKEEEEKFGKALENGEKEIKKTLERKETIDGKKLFYFYESFGFPLEMSSEILAEQGHQLSSEDKQGFANAEKEHQEKSRAGAEQKFAGGLADHSEETTALHTAAHLMLAGLREVLGDHVSQKGSNITAERLRFDFAQDEKLTPEQKEAVAQYVNDAIKSNASVTLTEMSPEEAEKLGAIGAFGHKYGEIVKVYTIQDDTGKIWSREICGGPHVESTGTMGNFQIKKEESSSRGVRRIKAVLEEMKKLSRQGVDDQ